MPKKTTNPPLKLTAGFAWRGPEDTIALGDEVLLWSPELQSPCWHKAVNMVGTTPAESEVFVRYKIQPTD